MYTSNIFTNIVVLILAILTYSIMKHDLAMLKMGILGLVIGIVIVIVMFIVEIVKNRKRENLKKTIL
ncbi:steroid 5-alpha reductase family enzyme [Paenibacillus sp. 1182]|nr:steroid 5-alpha reductase family enzyme [Paenibacillus sp. 1182]